LVQRLLARDSKNKVLLLPAASVLIAEPYAERSRRTWFHDVPVVASDYHGADPDASPNDWRSFFESLTPAPHGRLALALTAQSYSSQQLQELMGEGYDPPAQRASHTTVQWCGFQLSSSEYKILDADLPGPIAQRLVDSDPVTREENRAIAAWIAESAVTLKRYSRRKLGYIPFGWGYASEVELRSDATWITRLKDSSWVFVSDGSGPFCPGDVLARADPARPDAPVADLGADVVELLADVGVEFGFRLADAPAITQLRVHGSTASIEDLVALMKKAIDEAGGHPAKQELLQETLRATNLFPLPAGRESPDRLTRVPLDRAVHSEHGRSTLGWWVTARESFSFDSTEGELFDLVGKTVDMPTNTTGEQALDFLSWVWRTKPDAERVRGVLPRAYQYIREEIDEGDLRNRIECLRSSMVVFVQNKRQWLAADHEKVFLNDLPDGVRPPIDSEVGLATPGHLGDGLNDQVAVAELLGLKLLSSRVRIETRIDGEFEAPALWQETFLAAQQQLLDSLSEADADEAGQRDGALRSRFSLVRCEQIHSIVLDHGVEVERQPRHAVIAKGAIVVAGSPEEFAAELCQVLFNAWDLRLRNDLIDLMPRVAIQLSRIGDEQFWRKATTRGSGREAEPDSGAGDRDEREAGNGTDDEQEGSSAPNQGGQDEQATRGSPSRRGAEDLKSGKPDAKGGGDSASSPGRGHAASDREGMIDALLQKRDQIDRQLRELTSTGVVPSKAGRDEIQPTRPFRSDERFREAVMEYERRRGREPQLKGEKEGGHDIDSFILDSDGDTRKLLRRIEVKGKGLQWADDEIVELSNRQYSDATTCKAEAGVVLAADFDYWLYVVEVAPSGELNVLAIRNPARRAARFEFRGGTWRHLVDVEPPLPLAGAEPLE
jgi:hypothetical protein